jgi:hypothetical protein
MEPTGNGIVGVNIAAKIVNAAGVCLEADGAVAAGKLAPGKMPRHGWG